MFYYGIDMGAATERGGFFAWRWEDTSRELDWFRRNDSGRGWNECVETIATDSGLGPVHVAIEAPLWGLKDSKGWTHRIALDTHREYRWYVGAGGAVGLMAQHFLAELGNQIATKRPNVTLYETYISGFEPTNKARRKKRKPLPPFRLSYSGKRANKKDYPLDAHALDALWSLLLLGRNLSRFDIAAVTFALSKLGLESTFIDSISTEESKSVSLRDDAALEWFRLGILQKEDGPFEVSENPRILIADSSVFE